MVGVICIHQEEILSDELFRLRARVAKLEATVDFLMSHFELAFDYEPDANQGMSDEVRYLVSQGKKIEAIKIYREETGLGLREAKDAIDILSQNI